MLDAGNGLCGLLVAAGSQETALKLCQEITSRAPKAVWAWQGLGRQLLDQGRPESALVPLQSALRLEPTDAPTWEALGAAYHKLGRLTAALKASLLAICCSIYRGTWIDGHETMASASKSWRHLSNFK